MSESTNYNSTVHSFYLVFFGRPADPAGLKFWSDHLVTVNGDLATIAESFANSEEATVRFGDDTPAERIAEIYQQLFNRAPEAGGLAFWTNAVEQGHVSLAEVAISILDGAQGTDAGLVTLREQAVAAFSTQVETSGTAYDGYAAIEAARVLVRAVTPNASQEDLAKAVKAAVAFTDIASTNPAVVDAIATGSSLLALFDTKRGLLDPVTLVQALADVAEAAAGSPATLESLLRGGGMAKVLEVMPSRASLQDVVDALAEGGLPAAIDVVYPPRPTPTPPAPVTGVSFKFEGVDQGPDDRAPHDNVTNLDTVDIEFSFTGSLRTGETFQYSVDGGQSWQPLEAVGKTLTISQVDLWNGLPEGGHEQRGFGIMDAGSELTTKVEVRVADANDKTVKSISQDIVFDNLRPYGELTFVQIDDGAEGDLQTGEQNVDATFSIAGFDEEVFVQWRLKGEEKWADVKVDSKGGFTLQDIDLSEADQTVQVRVIDAAGNVGSHDEWTIDGPVGLELQVMPWITGVRIVSPADGKVQLDGKTVVTTDPGADLVAGIEAELREQSTIATGTLAVAPAAGGDALVDPLGLTYTLGTAAGDTLSGNFVWGFGGNDKISGTAGNDFLMGGDGTDFIFSNGGNDLIAAGAGADFISIGGDDTVNLGYMGNDTFVGEFKDKGKYELMDLIFGAKKGDKISVMEGFGEALPSIGHDFLTSDAPGQVALVRGSLAPSTFTASSNGKSYMLQWTDSNGINSIMLNDYQGAELDLEIKLSENTITLVDKPLQSHFSGIKYDFSASATSIILYGAPDDVAQADTDNGLLDASGFSLFDAAAAVSVTDLYTDGAGFGVQQDGSLQLAVPLVAGAYEISWSAGTFATASGTFGAGSTQFAGGASGNIVQADFYYKSDRDLDGEFYDGTDEGAAYLFRAGAVPTKLITNDYNDVVVASSGTVFLTYTGFSTQGQDLIVGFGTDDTLTFEGAAGEAIDKNVSGDIEWMSGPFPLKPTSVTEAVYFTTNGAIVSSELDSDLTPTMQTLRDNIDVSGLSIDDQFLIVVKNQEGTGAAILHFTAKDDNGEIDHHELELIGIFSDSILDTTQIGVGPLV